MNNFATQAGSRGDIDPAHSGYFFYVLNSGSIHLVVGADRQRQRDNHEFDRLQQRYLAAFSPFRIPRRRQI